MRASTLLSIAPAQLVREGAAIVDIGGESTRPGAGEIDAAVEIGRVVPVIERVAARIDAAISIDTSRPEVMAAAVAAGACIVNDVRALRAPGARELAAKLKRWRLFDAHAGRSAHDAG